MGEKLQWNAEKTQAMLTLELLSLMTWLLGILFFHLPLPRSSAAVEASETVQPAFLSDAPTILLTVLVALFLLYLLRKVRAVGLVVSILLGFLIYGTLAVFVEPPVAFSLTVMIVYIDRAYRSFVTNNALVLLGVFAAAMPFSLYYETDFLLTLLAIFAVYDIFGVVFTRLIPQVAMGAVRAGAPLLLMIPKMPARWRDRPTPEATAALMGAGDVFLPLLFLTAVSVQFGVPRALLCALGAVVGNACNLIVLSRMKTGIPAMPFLAAGIAVAYLLTR
jgi:presenilin-like A22 family membrane protease